MKPAAGDTIPVGTSPAGVAVGMGSVWVTNGGDGTVSRIDAETNAVNVTEELERELEALVLNCSKCGLDVHLPERARRRPGSPLRRVNRPSSQSTGGRGEPVTP